VVLDTNIVVSGLLWRGTAYRVLEIGRAQTVLFITSPALIEELRAVLNRDKFMERYERIDESAYSVLDSKTTRLVVAATIPLTVVADPSDDLVLACAKAADADYIVTGDPHLLRLGSYEDIPS
jgi:putative PIN family toxin of toxin-antitoxin system